MMTFRQFAAGLPAVPTATAWSLTDLGQALGRQDMFTKQSPQKLKALREHALIESAVSSNRIEGVEVEPKRVATLMFGTPLLRDRDEEEVRGYSDALKLIHEKARTLPVSVDTVQMLHRMTRGDIWDAGKFKQKAEPIIEHLPGGGTRIRFMPVEAGAVTEAAMAELITRWTEAVRDGAIQPLVAMGAFTLDFLCIHPFRDGNGRTSRLLTLLLCYHAGAEVGRYISLERLIEQNKDRYYETLQQASQGWHEGKHNPWPFINYLLWILKTAYTEFERRVGEVKAPRGEKTDGVVRAIDRIPGEFSVARLQQECPGVSVDMIRHVLKDLRAQGKVECLGRGPAAMWRRTGNSAIG
jgi:Fic family protein